MTESTKDESSGKQQARAQVRSICDLVAALECDYDRLEELREERDNYVLDSPLSDEDAAFKWRDSNPAEAEELAELEEAAGDCKDREEAERRIQEDPLSVEVRSGWQSVGESFQAEEFRIVLCVGGPHAEIRGELDENGGPARVRVLYSDWGESGELFDFDRDAVLTYCQQFYFGE